MEPEYGRGSSGEYSRPITEATSIRLESSPSISSSSSDSSIIDLFRVTAPSPAPGGNAKVVKEHNDDAQLSQKNKRDSSQPLVDYDNFALEDHADISRNSSSNLEENDEGFVGGTSPSIASDMRDESFQFNSLMQSPPLQVMGRSEYDPDRIPSSVFDASKESNQAEWSVASNESLFSIHVGNNSFSRDHVFWKSGELFKSGEFIMYNPSPSPSKSPGPPVPVVEEINEGVDVGYNSATTVPSQTATVAKEEDSTPPLPHPQAPQVSTNISSLSHQSDGSGNSIQSFAFPIKKRSWQKCYCSNCSWAFCYCKWLSCYCKQPRCYCPKSSCAFCHCTWPSCHCKWPSCYCPKFSCEFCCCRWPSCHCNWPSCNCPKCSWAFCYC